MRSQARFAACDFVHDIHTKVRNHELDIPVPIRSGKTCDGQCLQHGVGGVQGEELYEDQQPPVVRNAAIEIRLHLAVKWAGISVERHHGGGEPDREARDTDRQHCRRAPTAQDDVRLQRRPRPGLACDFEHLAGHQFEERA
jgi:hypothetical protein